MVGRQPVDRPSGRADAACQSEHGCKGGGRMLWIGRPRSGHHQVALWILGRTDGRMMEQEPLLAFPPFFIAVPVGFYLGAKAVDRGRDRQPPPKQ